jgi:hypothetical protein
MAASGIHEPLQEMTMRSRNNVRSLSPALCCCCCVYAETNLKDGKLGIQVMRPFASNPLENSDSEHVAMEETLIPSIQRDESPTRFPIFTEDVSPLINRTTSPFKPVTVSPPIVPVVPVPSTENSDINPYMASSEITLQQPFPEDLINPLDRSSSPDPQNPFADPSESQSIPPTQTEIDPSESHYEDAESTPLSRSSSRTMSLHDNAIDHSDIEDLNSMSDWTEAFDNNTDTEGLTDVDSDSDVVSDAESEASWARVRSRGLGFN